jgi:hypothetical protein
MKILLKWIKKFYGRRVVKRRLKELAENLRVY